ncbi:MAG: hypothetical protein ABSD74_12360 [Rhizomicrobium sp.]|jgi:hypothetical protein
MEHDREAGASRARSDTGLDGRDLSLRLLLAERAIVEAGVRIGELSTALAKLTGVQAGSPAPQHQSVVVDADAVSPFSLGFYQREYDKLGRPFRWTGKSDIFELRLRLDRNVPWEFTLELQPNANVDIKTLRAYADYVEIPIEVDGARKLLTGVIPERPFGTLATVTFLLPNRFVPAQVNPTAEDTRTLGVIFYELRATVQTPAIPAEQPHPAAAEKPNGRDETGAAGKAKRAPAVPGTKPAETTS